MTKKLKWRLSKLPTSTEVIELVNHKLITNEEAKEILFNSEEEIYAENEAPLIESLKAEIKFLRELVDTMSLSSRKVVETIKYIETPYRHYPWWGTYSTWCSTAAGTNTSALASVNGQTYAGSEAAGLGAASGFNSIKTF